jgi:acyl carrier protein
MSDEKIASRLRELLANFSGAAEETLGAHSTPQNTKGWDSAANLYLMAAIEDEFNVTIGTRDAMQLQSLGAIASFLEARGGAPAGTV